MGILKTVCEHDNQEESCDLRFGSWVYNAANSISDRTLTRWTSRTTLAAPCGIFQRHGCSGRRQCTIAVSTPSWTSPTPSGSTRKERCHPCSKPRDGDCEVIQMLPK